MSPRYFVKGKIGQGGLGEVYLATDTQLDRDVALKRVRPPESGSAEALHQDLIREARTLSALQHPNIVTIYDVGTDEQGPFVVMEYLKGETLDQVIERGALTVDDFREVVVQSLEGMIAAQALGLVHRDLKPGNLMVIWLASGKFQIKILDFGLAKFSLTATRQTEDQEAGIMGTIYFMAPEQFERLPLDARTDMYSLGCIFYQILTTKSPFDGQTGPEVMVSHLQHHVLHLVEARPDLPIWMADWVMWLISREMDDRPPDARTALDFFRAQTSGIKNPTPVPVTPIAPAVRIVGRGTGPGGVRPGGAATQRLPGSGTQRLQGTSATARSSRASARRIGKKKSQSGLWITLAIVAAAAGGAFWYLSQNKSTAPASASEIQALLDSPAPDNSPATWKLLFATIREGGDDAQKAAAVLKKLGGAPVAAAIAAELPGSSGAGRLILMDATAGHPSPEGKSQLLKIAATESGSMLTAALEALSRVAAPSDLEGLLRVLPKITAPANRTLLLQTIAKALRQAGPDGPASAEAGSSAPDHTAPLISAVRSADNTTRPELLKLLATTGDPAAAAVLNAELANPGDRRETALSLIPDWAAPQPSTADALLAAAAAPMDREALVNAFCHLAPRIAAWNGADFTAALRKAQPMATSAKNREAFASALGRSASPEAAAYAAELTASADWAGPAATASKAIAALQANAVKIAPGETTLETAKAVILAVDKDAYYSATSRYITNWKEPNSRVAWDLDVAEAGTATLQVLQATSQQTPRTFRIRLAKEITETPVKPTPSNEDFLPVEAGKFHIPSPGTWRLWIEPARPDPGQPLMNLRQISLSFAK
jgi:serine/threonine protein kinase